MDRKMANVSVDYASLYANHPSYNDIRTLVDDIPSDLGETCAIQLSYALNRAGQYGLIQNYDYPDPIVATGRVRAFQSDDGYNYIYSVVDLRVYLNNTFGTADNYKGTKASMTAGIAGRKGILAFGHRHVDLWDGNDVHRPSLYNMAYLWSCDSIQLRGVFFWEVTSQWGF
jgi:hypothetical protein